MALWLMWKNHFVKTIDYMEKYFKKKKIQHKCGILPQTNS